jgi:DNA polymerase-1
MAKIANFLIIYGGSAFTLSQSLGIDLAQAEFIVNQMKESIPTLFKWVEETQRKARQQGFLVNAYGLPRQLAPYYRMGESWASFADRTAVNTLVQSCGSVIIRIVLRKLWELIKNKYPTTVQFLATIHDEVNFRVKKSVLLAFLEDLERIMVGANHPEWEVKAGVEHSIGRNWAEVVAVSLVRDSEGHVVAVVPKGEKADHSKHVVLEKPAEIEDIIIEEWEEEE